MDRYLYLYIYQDIICLQSDELHNIILSYIGPDDIHVSVVDPIHCISSSIYADTVVRVTSQ